jgi:hypothetical protein
MHEPIKSVGGFGCSYSYHSFTEFVLILVCMCKYLFFGLKLTIKLALLAPQISRVHKNTTTISAVVVVIGCWTGQSNYFYYLWFNM